LIKQNKIGKEAKTEKAKKGSDGSDVVGRNFGLVTPLRSIVAGAETAAAEISSDPFFDPIFRNLLDYEK
jgi:hypothetical protein